MLDFMKRKKKMTQEKQEDQELKDKAPEAEVKEEEEEAKAENSDKAAYKITTDVTDVKGNLRTVKHTVDDVEYTIIYPTPLTPDDDRTGSFITNRKILLV